MHQHWAFLMGHTELEPSPKTSGKTALCDEGRAESGAVVADEVLEHLVANCQQIEMSAVRNITRTVPSWLSR